MAGVKLPGMVDGNGMSTDKLVEELMNSYNKMLKEMEFLLSHLDDRNITANSVTADSMNVRELSAITANLGTITAGLLKAVTIVGSLIQTREAGVYPRVELSATENIFKAMLGPNNKIEIVPIGDIEPTMRFISNGGSSFLFQWGDEFSVQSPRKIDIVGFQGTNVRNLSVDYKVRFGTLTQPYSAASTVAGVNVAFNQLVDTLKLVGVLA